MATNLSVKMEARPVRSVCWTLNHVGVWLLRVLPARVGVWVFYRALGWIPLMRYRIKAGRSEDDWRLLTVADVVESALSD